MIAIGPPRLPDRLRRLVELVAATPATTVADVGAGHGALAAHLAARGVPVIATEAAAAPWAELRANLVRWGVADAVDARRGRGLAPLAVGEVEVVVVAGMGGHALVDIAAQAPARGVATLVLQSVQDPHVVDAWLEARGWPVRAACDVVERGRHYPTWVVEVPR